MSLFSWFSARGRPQAVASILPSSGLSRLDSTRPHHAAARLHGTAQPANRKQERLERRELLYAVVRESMVRAGVLSSSYKFKVLSLDPRGRQFMVMVDLAYGGGAETSRLAEIEAMIAQSAKARHDILVSAVYWRANDHVASGEVQRPPISRPAPLEMPAPRAVEPAPPRPRVDPLHEDEIRAFKQALSAGVRGEQALAAAARPGRVHAPAPVPAPAPVAAASAHGQNLTLLTGFEDTELATDDDGEGGTDLSGTQWGHLR